MISLRGVHVHNLKHVDLDLPRGKLIAICGPSGSGKTSLALDTLYAEGQRRYIEGFSPYARQFLECLEKPAADKITGLPPAIAVRSQRGRRSSRATVGTATEAYEYLRVLFARIGRVFCLECRREVRADTPQSAADTLAELNREARLLILAPLAPPEGSEFKSLAEDLRERGFLRIVGGGRTYELDREEGREAFFRLAGCQLAAGEELAVVVDRLSAQSSPQRLRDSVETAFRQGGGRARGLVEVSPSRQEESESAEDARGVPTVLDGRTWRRIEFVNELRCATCERLYIPPEPRLFSFNSPLGACPGCAGVGNRMALDAERIVPDPSKSLAEGAIAPFSAASFRRELKRLLEFAGEQQIPSDAPFRELTTEQQRLVWEGTADGQYGGVRGFFAGLEGRKQSAPLRSFLSRWRVEQACPVCRGSRLRPEALAVRIGGKNVAELAALPITEAREFLKALPLDHWEREVGQAMLAQIDTRLAFLAAVGLGYLSLDRRQHSLSVGEHQRVTLTGVLGSSLVNMLYVLDEPSVGLHAEEMAPLREAIAALCSRGNTVVLVEHEEELLRSADQIIEIGPGAGERGGRVTFQGTPAAMQASATVTGEYLSGRRGVGAPARRRALSRGRIRLAGARGNNLKNVTVEFPLGVLCVVSGVSGAGKSSLVEDTLYPALRRRLRLEGPAALAFDDLIGEGQMDDVQLVDRSPIGRSPRSNPVTYVKAFDDIRQLFAETLEARTHNYTASHFSFNAEGGRCQRCRGDGQLRVDMQFLADVYLVCPQCRGSRYRAEILKVLYRGRNIAQALDLTVREAFAFFRGSQRLQTRLKQLIDVGLDYLRLGQPANTLSGGEAQRLKLAAHLAAAKRSRTLFLLDEPTTGLHPSDVARLLDCFDALLSVGHSLVVVEHDRQVLKAADHIIDLGPGPAQEGGRVMAVGTPEEIAETNSATGRVLKQLLTETERSNGS